MKRHPFRWEGLIFGVIFLAVVSTWLRGLGLFDSDQFAYVVAGGLITIGVAGILASVLKPRGEAPTTDREPEPRSSSSH
jgi:hypothetical protein